MNKLSEFWKNIFIQPINTVYSYHIRNNNKVSKVGIMHFLIAALILSLNYGIISVQSNKYLSTVGVMYYFLVGVFWGISLLILYNLILAVILKILFKTFNLMGQHYIISNIVLLSNFVFVLNIFSVFSLINTSGLSLILFLIISIIQSFFLEDYYEKKIYFKYGLLLFCSYIGFSGLSSIVFKSINLIM